MTSQISPVVASCQKECLITGPGYRFHRKFTHTYAVKNVEITRWCLINHLHQERWHSIDTRRRGRQAGWQDVSEIQFSITSIKIVLLVLRFLYALRVKWLGNNETPKGGLSLNAITYDWPSQFGARLGLSGRDPMIRLLSIPWPLATTSQGFVKAVGWFYLYNT